jgi:iron complex outermembrane receptor protein
MHTFQPTSAQGRLRRRPLASIVACLLALPGGHALAQAPGADSDDGAYRLELEEVLVTAQRREESRMTVPIAVNTFSAEDILTTSALDISDIDDFMPGVRFGAVTSNQSTQLGVEIRGVSSPNISSGQDPSVATFYDNAYLPRAVTSIPFVDIARIEVLKGPQGTLYGRNATAGVVHMIPHAPALGEFDAFARARVGNFGLINAEGMVNVPVGGRLAIRANVLDHQRDAIFDNVGVGDDLRERNYSFARLAVAYELSDRTRLKLAGDIEKREENTNYSIGVSKYALSTDPFNDEVENDVADRDEKRDMYGLSLQLEHELSDQLSLFGIVSYREWETFNKQDEDGTAAPRRYLDTNNIEDSDILYAETRFNFTNDRLDVVFGGNYSREQVYQRTDIGLLADSYMQFLSLQLLPAFGIPATADDHAWDLFADQSDDFWLGVSSLAGDIAVLPPSFEGTYFTETMDNEGEFVNWGIFGDVTFELTDALRLIGGLRYSYDDKEYTWQTFDNTIDGWPVAPARLVYDPAATGADPAAFLDRFEDDENWNRTTGRAVAEWSFMDSAMTYLSYATGYKSGGFDGQSFASIVAGPFDPEDMTSVELGLKGDFLGNRLRVEAALFHQELENRQGAESVKDGPDDPTAQVGVVSSDEETMGWELMAQWQVLETLRLTGLTTWRDTERVQDAFFDAQGEPQGGVKETLDTQNDYTLRVDWSPRIPVGSLLVHVDYIFNDAADDSEAVIFAEGPWYFQDRELLNARIAWSDAGETLEVALWGRNLLDKEYASNPGGFVADTLGAFRTNVQDPLTYGMEVLYNF